MRAIGLALMSQVMEEEVRAVTNCSEPSGPLEHAVWDEMMRGLSTRNYGAVVKDFHEAYGWKSRR